MCGSGTLVLEAALMASDCAPGLLREYFGFLAWSQHSQKLWLSSRQQAQELRNAGLASLPVLYGYDQDKHAISAADANAAAAGLSGVVRFRQQRLEQLVRDDLPKSNAQPEGLIITNPLTVNVWVRWKSCARSMHN